MKLSDGTVQTFETNMWYISFHAANSYVDADGTLVLEAQTYENKDVDPFTLVDFAKLNDPTKVL